MNLKEQEYICTVARCGSITQAAKQLFITQPALSSYIRKVEKALGVELFSHEGKQIRLTYAGERYVEKAEQMLAMRQEYLREVQDIQRGLRGRVCVGMQQRRGPTLVVRIMKRFQEAYPYIGLQFYLGAGKELQEAYRQGQIDVLIHNDRIEWNGTVNKKLLEEKLLLVVPRKDEVISKSVYLPEIGYRWLDLKEVENHVFLLATKDQSLRKDCDQVLKENGVAPNKIMEIGHIDTCVQMAAEGLGVCFTRESYAMQFQYEKRPVFLAVGSPLVETPLYAVYQERAEALPHIDFLIQEIQRIVEDVIATKMI